MKRILLIAAALGTLLLGAVGLLLWVAMPEHGPDRIVIDDHVVGVRAGYSYAYIVHDATRAVLIDAGADPEALALKAELRRLGLKPQNVVAVLITHGHRDHWDGLRAFQSAVAWVGRDDHLLVRGDALPRAPLARLAARLGKRPPVHPHIREVLPAMQLTFGNWTFDAISVPGHTPGSMMYRLGDILFTGDSLMLDGEEVGLPPRIFSDSPSHNARALRRLREVPFAIIADGHTGVARDGRQRFERWLQKHATD